MTSAVDASPNERRIGLLWGIFIVSLERTSEGNFLLL